MFCFLFFRRKFLGGKKSKNEGNLCSIFFFGIRGGRRWEVGFFLEGGKRYYELLVGGFLEGFDFCFKDEGMNCNVIIKVNYL